MTEKKKIFFLALLTFAVFSPCLSHGFIGDDEVVIVKNSFYGSVRNVPRLFRKSYLTRERDVFVRSSGDFGSGSVAYRPVLSATYFLDHYLWQAQPFGYHLSNLLIHVGNVVLVFTLFSVFLKKRSLAFWSALFFAVHPVQVEAVCAIGYRADILSAFFGLAAFWFYVRCFDGREKNNSFFIAGAYVLLMLSLFTKESAVVFPLLFWLYDRMLRKKKAGSPARVFSPRHAALAGVLGGYLFVYVFLFPNTNLAQTAAYPRVNPGMLLAFGQTFWHYAQWSLVPFKVDALPPLFVFPLNRTASLLGLVLAVLAAAAAALCLNKKKQGSFFVLWFLIALAPVSGLVPLPNPVAHRFLYVPFFGFCGALALVIGGIMDHPKFSHRFVRKIPLVWVTACLLAAFPHILLWRDNATLAMAMIHDYPRHYKGYSVLGIEYFKHGLFDMSRPPLLKALELGDPDPRIHYMLGAGDPIPWRAEKSLLTAVRLAPDYGAPQMGLGKLYFEQGRYEKALPYFERACLLRPGPAAFGYLTKCFSALGQQEKARDVLTRAREEMRDPEAFLKLEAAQDFLLVK